MLPLAPAALVIISYQLWILQAGPAERQGGAGIKEGAPQPQDGGGEQEW